MWPDQLKGSRVAIVYWHGQEPINVSNLALSAPLPYLRGRTRLTALMPNTVRVTSRVVKSAGAASSVPALVKSSQPGLHLHHLYNTSGTQPTLLSLL